MEEENDEDVDEEPMEEDDGVTEPTKTRGGKSPEPIETVEEEGGRRNRKGGRRVEASEEEQQPPKSSRKGKKAAEEQEDSEDDFQETVRPTRRTRRRQ